MGAIARTFSAVRMARRSERADVIETLAFQSRRLRMLVEHAYENVPYYRRIFDAAGLHPRHIRSVADLHLIPISSRADLQDLPASDLVARGMNPRRLMIHKTSGTTGKPMLIMRTWLENRALGALRASDLSTYGIRPSDRIVSLIRYEVKKRRGGRVILAASRAAGRFTSEGIPLYLPPTEILDSLVRSKPDVIAGFPTILANLADFIREAGHPGIRPRIAISGGETLTPEMARKISDTFGCRVYDKYGSNEFGRVASQCPQGSQFHVCGTGVIAEVLRDGKSVAAGEDGEVIGTGLHSFAMPFIRYRLGDVVNAGADRCDCGRSVQTLGSIRGRTHEYFDLPDGRRLHFYVVRSAFYDMSFRWMREYRLEQPAIDRVVLRVVPSLPPTDEELATIRERTARILGVGVQFSIEIGATMPNPLPVTK